MARCPNCARTVRFWRNYSGYCSKQCRTESITSCPGCGTVGLYKHERLGCCSEECRCWYVASLLGYDKAALVTPAWDKIVYHVRLPSSSAEISSLQLDELEYDRAVDTVLVVAAPPWMTRSKVLAELPYERFDNAAWQHLWADGTLTEEELFRFHRACYNDDMLCQKLGEHVFARLHQPVPSYTSATPPPAYLEPPAVAAAALPQLMAEPAERLPRIATPEAAPVEFVNAVRAIFEARSYKITAGGAENTLVLERHGHTALAAYVYQHGMVDVEPVQRAVAAATAMGATQTFVVTNSHFTLHAEDFAVARPVQLIDGDAMATLATHRRSMPMVAVQHEFTPALSLNVSDDGMTRSDGHTTERASASSPIEMTGGGSATSRTEQMAPVDAEIVGGEGAV
jgi:Restriction endonuclease